MGSRYDVVVVGGGPAGASTATWLARAGFAVVLLDRSPFPRRKACGECVNPGAVAALDRLGLLSDVLASGAISLGGWRIHPQRGPSFAGRFPDGRGGLAVERSRFDAVLLDGARGAGVDVRLGERVTDLVWRDGRVTGVKTGSGALPARLVVGADGLRSVVVRRLGLLRRGPRLRKLALTAHLEGATPLSGEGALHLQAGGCIGIVAVSPELTNVVVVVQGPEAARVAGRQEQYFDEKLVGLSELAGSRRVDRVLTTGPFDWPIRSAIVDGALLVGDAAGYFDPFTGQGIYRALRGAELAADAAGDALHHGSRGTARLRRYEEARRRAFAPGERLQWVLELILARPPLVSLAASAFVRRPALADALIQVTGDLRGVRSPPSAPPAAVPSRGM